ncbi:hypothetical protein PHYSODRAFT_306320 [Phytophthora sojae]|uniref:Kazal-like domain-containing protein n=1 Tax=Phytophthora sojae (strain P6497) TaxID=1094619 RepID=G5A926_PHYSP|nr:hypothetical protein PHYSODRAFT_306320 [Phytophthora sojae]EGZ08402.1 hypothetical protein PHYSODRAFT_306320 [Phytophthora sojae]|eukprot:XP_009536574.1 hypothetical protein PHYSODRAFT_306320 [Phytophthora sojae]
MDAYNSLAYLGTRIACTKTKSLSNPAVEHTMPRKTVRLYFARNSAPHRVPKRSTMKFAAALIAAAMIVSFSAQSSGSTCILDCPSTYGPVCGDNGVTYPNECALDNGNCLLTNGDYIFTKSQGSCSK